MSNRWMIPLQIIFFLWQS